MINIIKYCNRPYKNAWEMNKALTENWNAVVKPDDIVYHLGDFSFQSDRYRNYLNGHIILIRGNHDKAKYNNLFDEVVDSIELKIGEFNCYLAHIPVIRGEQYKKGQEPDFVALEKKGYSYYIVGHIHEKWKTNGNNVNVGVDVWDYKPININDLARFLRGLKEIEK